jgi:hypothetical protein
MVWRIIAPLLIASLSLAGSVELSETKADVMAGWTISETISQSEEQSRPLSTINRTLEQKKMSQSVQPNVGLHRKLKMGQRMKIPVEEMVTHAMEGSMLDQ